MAEDTAPERWLPIPGYEGYYDASDHGRIRSLDRTIVCKNGVVRSHRGRVLSPGTLEHGHQVVNLHGPNGATGTTMVHHLVLMTFVGPRPPNMGGLHWDDNPRNNHLSNLRWGTQIENMRDCLRNGHNDRANRTMCPRHHPLEAPNLTPSELLRQHGRKCLACGRATNTMHMHIRAGLADPGTVDLQRLSDMYYGALLATEGASQVRIMWSRAGRALPLLSEIEGAQPDAAGF